MKEPKAKLKPQSKGAAEPPARRARGFEPAGRLIAQPLRDAGARRGFALTRLLTDWAEIAGPSLAIRAQPLKIAYGREGLGATLTLLVRPAEAPLVQMQLEPLKARVNAAYGYAAIARIHLTQTAPQGFAEGATPFTAPKAGATPAAPRPADPALARLAESAADPELRAALAALVQNRAQKPSSR